MDRRFQAVVAGHICLDVIPGLEHHAPGAFGELFKPGHLVTTGPAMFSTGGPVSNTGLALFRLGVPTRLIAKVGDDPFGQTVRGLVERFDPALASGLVVDGSASTSYSVIISPPGVDRIFLHHPGANDRFGPEDVDLALVADAGLFHFGYPPLMRRMYADGGAALAEVFRRAKVTGVSTSLDMAFPDPGTESGRADWRAILRAALPYVDVFLPSVEEILFMLRREQYQQLASQAADGSPLAGLTAGLLSELSAELMDLGARMVVLKLGARGLYLRTSSAAQLGAMGRAAPSDAAAWADREIWAPCFQVKVVGTTGSGDATIAGFLGGLLRDLPPEAAVTSAVAVGACNVEAADALSGVCSWEETQARIRAGWGRHALALEQPGWHWDAAHHLWHGPAGR